MNEVLKSTPQSLGPPPLAVPGQEDLLGRRISAALIDVGLLLGVFVVLGLTIGQTSVAGGVWVTLGGVWAGVYLALVLLYYFVLEAAIGQTVGKRLLGLRVVRPDGSRPSLAAIAVRTLLRVVDWLPLGYLVGFVAMLATGERRQRLGDLAAKTTVGRALAVRHRGLALAPVALVVVLVGLSAYYGVVSGRVTSTSQGHRFASGNATSTYLGHGVSFDYPAGWQEGSKVQTRAAGSGDTLWGTAVAADQVNLVLVRAYRLPVSVTAENLDAVTAGVQAVVQRLLEQPAGTVQAVPEKLSMGGLPGLRFRGTATADGAPVASTMVFAFDHTTEYFLNCQSTRARAAEIQRGCDQIVRSFKVASPSSASAAAAPGWETRSSSPATGPAATTSTWSTPTAAGCGS